ncbi:MAG: ABC transporter ATP-binding protein [bacterium]|nr:ABC transporter ATP-binding protein [bacterium]
MGYTIETVNLTKRFHQPKGYKELLLHPFSNKEVVALKDVSLQVKEGELFSILGPNGAGKSTLIKILCTLILPTEGKAYINGKDVTKNSDKVKESIGYVINEERSFYWRLTGYQNLKFFASLNNLFSRDADKIINRILEFVNLKDSKDIVFRNYSTGMKQRLSIARALLTEPNILFMDEPTKSLDPDGAREIREFIKEEFVKNGGRTVFFATHNLTEAEQLSDHIAILDKGELKACGSVADLKQLITPAGLYVLMTSKPSSNCIKQVKSIPGICKLTENDAGLELEVYKDKVHTVIKEIIALKLEIIECQPKTVSLEKVFSELIKVDNGIGK